MFKNTTALLSTVFLLLPTTQSVSFANELNNQKERTYEFSLPDLASGYFTGIDQNQDGFLETSEITDFTVSDNSNYNRCETKDLKELNYEIPRSKLNKKIQELEAKIFEDIVRQEGISIRIKQKEIRYAINQTIDYVLNIENISPLIENNETFLKTKLEEQQISESLLKDETITNILDSINQFYLVHGRNTLENKLSEIEKKLNEMRKGSNIYIHCLSKNQKSKIEFIFNNKHENNNDEEIIYRTKGSYSIKISTGGFLNGNSTSISGPIWGGELSVQEKTNR